MKFSETLNVKLLLLPLLFATTITAIAVDPFKPSIETRNIVKRVPGDDKDHPIDAHFDITKWPNIAEQDCYVALCLMDGQRIFRRVFSAAERRTNNRASGAELTPFQEQELERRRVSQINHDTVSAEEFPWESIWNDPDNPHTIHVQPATRDEQNDQGSALSVGYQQVPYSKWFRITFDPAEVRGRYCRALHATPPDKSVCEEDLQQTLFGTASIVLAQFVYHIINTGGRPYFFEPSRKPGGAKMVRDDEGAERSKRFHHA